MSSLPDFADDDITFEDARCDTHGPFQRRVLQPWPGAPAIRGKCPECAEAEGRAAAAETKRREALERQLEVRRLTGLAGIPPRFADRSFAAYQAETTGQRTALGVCRRFAQDFPAQRERGRSLVLTGGPGTGKTHLACAIANAVMADHLAVARFVTVSDMLRRIKETYRKDATMGEGEVIRGFVACDLLVLDEIGVQVGSEHEKLLLFEVLNGRYQELRPTILLSNLSADELEDFLGHRVMDRFRECGTVLAFDWDSYRGRRVA